MKELSEGLRSRLARQISLIGEEKTLKLVNASCAVIGLGGVGGYVCEMLARVGVGRLYLVDCDTVSVSNLNRQIIALESTVGSAPPSGDALIAIFVISSRYVASPAPLPPVSLRSGERSASRQINPRSSA